MNWEPDDSDSQTTINEPIRESLMLFIIKIASVLIIIDLVYAVLNFVLLRAFFLNHELPFNLHDMTAYILTFLHPITRAKVWGFRQLSFVGLETRTILLSAFGTSPGNNGLY